jgi:hypothetical protein
MFKYRIWIHRGDADELEELLNDEAAEGWRLHSITLNTDRLIVIFERTAAPAAGDGK